jgi:hypothetical protein
MMKEFKEVVKKLAKRGIRVKRVGTILAGWEAYRVVGQGFHPEALWSKQDIMFANRNGEFAKNHK